MKLLLLKILLTNQTRDRGYAIPVVFALGLIMTLVGMISIFQSSDEEIISISKRETSEALAAAEAGIARYREQINKYKAIAMYNVCSAWATSPSVNCNDTSGSTWKTASLGILNLNTYCPASGSTKADNDDNVEALATRAWQNIGSNASQGQYRLIDYTYSSGGTINASGGYVAGGQPTGTLTVEGRVNQNNTNIANESGAAVASIQVTLPIQPGLPNPDGVRSLDDNLNGFNPALWLMGASDATNIDLGDIEVNGNIVVTDGDCVHSGNLPVANDLADTTKNSIIVDPRSDVVAVDPSTTLPTGATSLSQVREITLADLTTESLPLDRLNAATDESSTVDGDTVYYYKLVDALGAGTDLTLVDGDTIKIRSGRKVVLFVEGDIDIEAGATDIDINNEGTNNSSHLEIYMTDDASTIDFRGTGNVTIEAFLHAPGSPVTVLSDPTVDFTGAMWVENFTGKNLTNAFSINADDQYFNYTRVYDFLVTSGTKIADPIISPPSEWNTLQTN